MGWYIARSLDQLLKQVNEHAPARSKVSDGGIGDARHSASLSDHNPTTSGQVCARDFTNDPVGGLDAQWLADRLVESRDSRIKYIISRGRIIDSRLGQHPWQWMPYSGANRHDKHVHVSVFSGSLGDNARAWDLGPAQKPQPGGGSAAGGATNSPTIPPLPPQKEEEAMIVPATHAPGETPGDDYISIQCDGKTLLCISTAFGRKVTVMKLAAVRDNQADGNPSYVPIGMEPKGPDGKYGPVETITADMPGPIRIDGGCRVVQLRYSADHDFTAWCA